MSLCLNTCDGGATQLSLLAVPIICDPLSNQPIAHAIKKYDYLANLDFADYSCVTDMLEVYIFIRSDHYWKLVTEVRSLE